MKELTQMNNRIVLLIADAMPLGLTPSQIRQQIQPMKPQALYLHLKTLLKKGILIKHKEGILTYYRIAPEGINMISRLVVHQPQNTFTPLPPPSTQPEPTQITARAHKFGIAYPLKDPLTTDTPTQLLALAGIPAQQVALTNNEQAYFSTGTITARLTNKTLLLYTRDLYTDNRTPSIELENIIKAKFDALALNLEAKLQRIAAFKLRRIDKDTLESHITTQHWAEEQHPAAEQSAGSPVILAKHPADGKTRLGIDISKGFRELETYHSRTADIDKDVIDREFNALLDGQINLFDIPAHSQAIADLLAHEQTAMDIIQEYGKQINIHIPYFEKQTEVLEQYKQSFTQYQAFIQQQQAKQHMPGLMERIGAWIKRKR